MERIFSTDLLAKDGQQVRIAGWLHHQRELAKVTFALIRDAKGIAQVVIEDDSLREHVGALLPGSVVEVEGLAVRTEQAPEGVEIHEPQFRVISTPSELPPSNYGAPR